MIKTDSRTSTDRDNRNHAARFELIRKQPINIITDTIVSKQRHGAGFLELGDWIVPKIGLYLHPISADNPMEPFLEISIFS